MTLIHLWVVNSVDMGGEMVGIQQEFQGLLKLLDSQHALCGVIKELARIAGVLSDGQKITYATSLLGHSISTLSPRHAFLRQFEVALKLSAAMKQHEGELKKYPEFGEQYKNIQNTLETQIQEELKRYSEKFRDCYSQICQETLKLSEVPAVSVDEVRKFFDIPTIEVPMLEAAKEDIWPGVSPVKSQSQVERELQKMLNENDKGSLRIFAQAGYGPAIEKLYSTEPLKMIACHLVYALHFSNFAGIKRAVESIDISKHRDILPWLLKITVQVLPGSPLPIDKKRETIKLLYDKLREVKQPTDFLNSLLRIEMYFLYESFLCLQKEKPYISDQRTDAVFTVGYLLQLACVNLYDYFKDAKACWSLCQDFLSLREEIAGKGNSCYYISPDTVRQTTEASLALEKFRCSDAYKPVSRCCLQ